MKIRVRHTTRIAFASFIGTAIEFYDFYIYDLAVAMAISMVATLLVHETRDTALETPHG